MSEQALTLSRRVRRALILLLLLLVAILVWPVVGDAQPVSETPVQPVPPVPPAEAAPAVEQAVPVEAYTYGGIGRRDPFVSLISRGTTDVVPGGLRPAGLSGLTINDVALRGIVLSQGEYIAIVQSPSQQTFMIREGARLFDGAVRSITAEAVVFMQEVSDPLSLIKEREVRKLLRPNEEGR